MQEKVKKTYKGVTVEYNEVYTLGYEVNEDTGERGAEIVKYYTKEQVKANINALKQAFD